MNASDLTGIAISGWGSLTFMGICFVPEAELGASDTNGIKPSRNPVS